MNRRQPKDNDKDVIQVRLDEGVVSTSSKISPYKSEVLGAYDVEHRNIMGVAMLHIRRAD